MTLKMAEDNKEKLNIRLFVYDMEMPLRCERSDEEYYRKAGTLITETLNTYYSYFKGKKSDKEILYAALIDIAIRYEKEAGHNDLGPVTDILSKLTSEIEDALKK